MNFNIVNVPVEYKFVHKLNERHGGNFCQYPCSETIKRFSIISSDHELVISLREQRLSPFALFPENINVAFCSLFGSFSWESAEQCLPIQKIKMLLSGQISLISKKHTFRQLVFNIMQGNGHHVRSLW